MEKVTYRAVEECISRLGHLYQQSDDLEASLFCSEAAVLRQRLKSALVKVIFLTPADFGAKGEELLWRKVFYEVLAFVKKRRLAGRLTSRVEALYRAHLLSGLGFYQQLLSRILLEHPVTAAAGAGNNLEAVDFAPAPKSVEIVSADGAIADWARGAVHRCLMHIGDLYRYLREFQGEVALALVQRYYGAAARFEPTIGLPYNQLGTLDVGNYYNLTAVYYYLRCLACEQPFDGSRRNLAKILIKNQRRFDSLPPLAAPASSSTTAADPGRPHKPVKQFAVRFLHLIGRLLQPQYLQQHRRQNQRQQDAELNALCQSALTSLSACLSGSDEASNCLAVRASEVDPLRPHRLADSAVLQAALTAVLCLDALSATNSRHSHACTAFCLGMFACVLQCALARCRHALSTPAAELSGASASAEEPPVDEASEDGGAEEEIEELAGEEQDEEEEEEIAGDFPGFSAPRRRQRQRRPQRRRRRSGDSSSSSSGESSDCQLVFGYGEEDDDEDNGRNDKGRADNASDSSDTDLVGEGEAVAAAPANSVSSTTDGGGGLPSFCFSYGIPSALTFRDDDDSAEASGAAAASMDQHIPSLPASGPAIDDVDAAGVGQSGNEDAAVAKAEAAQLLLGRVRLMQTVKLLLDWMLCQPHLLSRVVQSSCLPLWDHLASLLNLLPAPPGEDCGVLCPEPEQQAALPEDAHARGLRLFRPVQRHLDFARTPAAPVTGRLDESRLRLAAIRRFGFLAVQNDQLAFEYDSAGRQFLGPSAVVQASRDAQMRNLAQLRLINQVQQLETAVSMATPSITASHVVPSRQCLTDGLDKLQALVRSRRCVLVLPRSSIDHLDRLKRSSQAARRASRYLETELQSGRGLINAHDYSTLVECASNLSADTAVFLVCRGEAPPPIDLPFQVRELDEFVRQALTPAPGQAG